MPQLVTIAVRDCQPVNLVSAFEAPVAARRGIVGESCLRLADEMRRVSDLWGMTPMSTLSTYELPDDTESAERMRQALGAPLAFPELLASAVETAAGRLAGQGSD